MIGLLEDAEDVSSILCVAFRNLYDSVRRYSAQSRHRSRSRENGWISSKSLPSTHSEVAIFAHHLQDLEPPVFREIHVSLSVLLVPCVLRAAGSLEWPNSEYTASRSLTVRKGTYILLLAAASRRPARI